MDENLYARALELLRAGCPASRGVVEFAGGASRVYEMGNPSRLSFILDADRDRVTRAAAEDAAGALVETVTRAAPELADRLRWAVVPRSDSAALLTPAATEMAEAASTRLGELLRAHEATCDEHRDTPGYLVMTEVEPQIGWHADEDHLLAWFCVDSSCASEADDACCAKAVATVKMEMPELERLRWQCTPYR